MSHDSGFRRKSHDRSTAHRQRKHRDHASRFFEQKRSRRQLRSRTEQEETPARPDAPADDAADEEN